MVFPSEETSRDIQVPSDVVKATLRVGFRGSLFPRLSAFSSARIKLNAIEKINNRFI
jgi:hypothetical protein